MIERYAREEMTAIWTREFRFRKWLDIELAVLKAQSELGVIPEEIYAEVAEKADFTIEEIDQEEEKTKHEIVAFLNSVFSRVSDEAGRYIHYGLTSSDVMDTGTNLQLKDANAIIAQNIDDILKVLKRLVNKYKYTPIIGRSHGVHAEPTTFGLKLAIFYAEFRRAKKRFADARADVEVGKISGPVGNYTMIDPKVEEMACDELGIGLAPITNQVVQRDRYAYYMTVMGVLASTIEKLAVELRNLARTELSEIEEPFSAKQKGSSAMPHKRNPVGLEQITGLCRMIRSYSMPAMENQALWHERDISHSSVERIILPDATVLMNYILVKITNILDNMNVATDKMLTNIDLTKGLVFSQRLMIRLINAGLSRSKAHTMVQGKIMACWKEGRDFREQIRQDGEIRRYITIEEIEALFDLDLYTRQVSYILNRVFKDDED